MTAGAPLPPRPMTCPCGHTWETPAVQPDGPLRCPNCGDRVCACGCGESLSGQRADSRYKSRACEMRLRRRNWGGDGPPTPHIPSTGEGSRGGNVRSLQHARSLQQTFKAEWTERVRLHMARTLVETGHLHADDLEPLNVPADHANVRGSQFGSFCSQGFMEPTGVERKVAHAAANARKGKIFRITEKGRRELRKLVGAGATEAQQGEGSAGTHHRGQSATALAPSTGPGGASIPAIPTGAPSSEGADPGESSAEGRGFAGNSATSPSDAAPGGASPDQLFPVPGEKPSTSPYGAEAA